MNLSLRPAALLAALALSPPLAAQSPDLSLAPLLDTLGYTYQVDEDGDYRLLMEVPDSDRTQLVFVRSLVEEFGSSRVREVWSPALEAQGEFPEDVANHLLQASAGLKLGGWERHGRHAVLVVKIPAAADAFALGDAITAADVAADRMELEMGGPDAEDAY